MKDPTIKATAGNGETTRCIRCGRDVRVKGYIELTSSVTKIQLMDGYVYNVRPVTLTVPEECPCEKLVLIPGGKTT